ncbi:MAG TPA: Crp/Fnr family transcriptional regulator, partial [Planctomycetaceae bacterium]
MIDTASAGNRLLEQLPEADRRRLSPWLERVKLKNHEVVVNAGEVIRYAYFPVTSILSSMIVMQDGTVVEAAAIGNEGMAGVGLLVDERTSPYRTVQQIAGESLRISADRFRTALVESRALRELVERFLLALLRQGSQAAACNLLHSVQRRTCNWLLTCADRLRTDHFRITQESLSEMLGVARPTVTVTAGAL